MDFIILPFILGFLIFTLIQFLIFRKSEEIIFTQNITTNKITFTKDYQKLLSETAINNYDIIYKETTYFILNSKWSILEIVSWLNSLEEQDYAVTFHLIQTTSEEINSKVINDEFIVNPLSDSIIISRFLTSLLDHQNCRDGYLCLINYTVLKAVL